MQQKSHTHMTLTEYINVNRGNGLLLAGMLGVSQSYVSQMASGHRPISPNRCLAIERATGGLVTRGDLRKDAHMIWPDLGDEPTTHEASR